MHERINPLNAIGTLGRYIHGARTFAKIVSKETSCHAKEDSEDFKGLNVDIITKQKIFAKPRLMNSKSLAFAN